MIKQVIELILVVVIGMLPVGADSAETLENKGFAHIFVMCKFRKVSNFRKK